ncbi:MAG: cupin domain-containing protein [Moorellaceae bacterium]
MPVIKVGEVEAREVFPKVFIKSLVDYSTGAAAVTSGEITLHQGGVIPLHIHKVEEVMHVVKGKGTLKLGEESYALEEGMVIHAPAGVKHSLSNEYGEPLKIIFAFPAVQVERILI